jgi:hypothetical protein
VCALDSLHQSTLALWLLLHNSCWVSFKVVNSRVQPSVMTCSKVIFWKPGYLGVYSICSTIWVVQGSNCSRDKNFSLLHNDQTGSGVPGFFTWIKLGRVTTDIHPILRLEWSCTSTPSICFPNVDRENFIIEFVMPVCSV